MECVSRTLEREQPPPFSSNSLEVILFAASELISMYEAAAESLPITLHPVSSLKDLREEADRMVNVSPILFIFDLLPCHSNAVLQSIISISKDYANFRTNIRIGIMSSKRSRPFHKTDLHYVVKRESATTERLQITLTSCIKAAGTANFKVFDTYRREEELPSEQDKIPTYLRNVPELVRTTFQEHPWCLSSQSQGFRELVKKYCHLPAYFAVVLFRRIKQYKSIAQQLCRENVLKHGEAYFPQGEDWNSELDSPAEDECIGIRDFLRFCTEDFCSATATEKFLKLIHEPAKDEILSLETDQEGAYSVSTASYEWKNERVEKSRLKPFVEALIERHPDLACLRTNSTKRKAYIKYVLESIFSSLEGVAAKSTTVERLCQSNMVDVFYKCAVNRLCQLSTFDISRFETMFTAFCDALVSGNEAGGCQSIITAESLRAAKNINNHLQILDAVFPLPGNGCGFHQFLQFLLAQEDGMSSKSIDYWFHILDYDHDGYLCRSDLECAFRNKLFQARIPCSEEIIDMIMLITVDMVKPHWVSCNADFRISPLDIRRSGSGYLLYDVFIKSSVSDIELRAHDYA